MSAAEHELQGHFDCVRGRTVHGWAWRRAVPTEQVAVRILVDGTEVAQGVADLHRPDLQAAGIGSGEHSYQIILPESVFDEEVHEIVVLGPESQPLCGSPARLVLPRLIFQPLPPDPHVYDMDLAVCCIVRNEAPYLMEWLAHHRVVGVQHFLVFDNDSTDGTSALLDVLQAAGVVERVPWPNQEGVAPQFSAYEEGLRRLRDRAKWIAYIDLDEFLLPLEQDNVRDILRDYDGAAGLVVPWRVFGSSGESVWRDELVTRRFIQRARDDDPINALVKSIVRGRYTARTGIHTPQSVAGCLVDEHGRLAGAVGDPDRHTVPDARRLVLNHYFTKSRAEWNTKRQRGCATSKPGDNTRIRPDHYFDTHDKNDVFDERMKRLRERTVLEIRKIQQGAQRKP